jgi:hypothetical protein
VVKRAIRVGPKLATYGEERRGEEPAAAAAAVSGRGWVLARSKLAKQRSTERERPAEELEIILA